ncbi:hypothetical protein D920_01789 [Enterococcus faecalis 13-SD-W-01]|nr:hypothetical protein D920_01789 [Enterococcus faecalis 13-SD-W-01]
MTTVAASFLFWGVQELLGKWCKRYTKKLFFAIIKENTTCIYKLQMAKERENDF